MTAPAPRRPQTSYAGRRPPGAAAQHIGPNNEGTPGPALYPAGLAYPACWRSGPRPPLRRAPLWGRPAARDGPRCALSLRGAPGRLAGTPALPARPPRPLCGVRAGRAVARGGSPGLRCGAARPFSGLAGPLLWSRRPGGPCAPAAPRSARPPGLAPALGLALAVRALPGRSGLLRCGLGLGAPRCGLFGGRPCGGPGPPAPFPGAPLPPGAWRLAGAVAGRSAAPCASPRLRRLGGLRPPAFLPLRSACGPRFRAAALVGGCAALRPLWCRPRALALRSFALGSPYLPPAPVAPLGLAGGAWLAGGMPPSFRSPLNPHSSPKAPKTKGFRAGLTNHKE